MKCEDCRFWEPPRGALFAVKMAPQCRRTKTPVVARAGEGCNVGQPKETPPDV